MTDIELTPTELIGESRIPKNCRQSFKLIFREDISLVLTAPDTLAPWLGDLASILGSNHAQDAEGKRIMFIKTSRWRFSPARRRLREQLERLFPGVPASAWKAGDLKVLSILRQENSDDMVIELRDLSSPGRRLLSMWYAMGGIFQMLRPYGGLPLHSALISLGNKGVLLVASDGAGKSTCCRRIPEPWTARADDAVLILPNGNGDYYAHPLPTWSEIMRDRGYKPVPIESRVPLAAIFFMEKGAVDAVTPVGQGHAALMLSSSSTYISSMGRIRSHSEEARFQAVSTFENSVGPAGSIPCFKISVTLTGEFWKKIEEVI